MLVACAGHDEARAADSRYPDWPCVQAKVPELSVIAMWAGPPLDDAAKAWENDPKIKELVAGKEIVKVLVVPARLVNLVVR